MQNASRGFKTFQNFKVFHIIIKIRTDFKRMQSDEKVFQRFQRMSKYFIAF